ncbi:MAG: 1-acyl-sn-glycerol-3-phosphate acyltransferase [Nanoarchaeota archaeon]|nr:1-acyl-sn-glycerol-3-phosphate acyltransferase [Nanoarchaeota archaeon]
MVRRDKLVERIGREARLAFEQGKYSDMAVKQGLDLRISRVSEAASETLQFPESQRFRDELEYMDSLKQFLDSLEPESPQKRHDGICSNPNLGDFIESSARRDLEGMVSRFNPFLFNLYVSTLAKWKYRHILKNIQVEEENPGQTIDNLKTYAGKEPMIVVANHCSNVDHVVLGMTLHRYRITMPLIQAGSNLAQGKSKKYLPLLGAYLVDRSRLGRDGKIDLLYAYNRSVMRQDNITCLLLQNEFFQAGRSYDGSFPGNHHMTHEPKRFDSSLVGDARSVERRTDRPVRVQMVTFTYSWVPEAEMLMRHYLAKETVPDTNLMREWEEFNRFFGDYESGEFPIVMYIHEPRPLQDFAPEEGGAASYTKKMAEAIGKAVYVLPVPLAAMAFQDECSYYRVVDEFIRLRNELLENGARLHPSLRPQIRDARYKDLEPVFYQAIKTHQKAGIIDYEHPRINVKNRHVFDFMVNSLAHLSQ